MKTSGFATKIAGKIGVAIFFTVVSVQVMLAQSLLPVTNRPFDDDPGKVQFVVVADLWGGNRPGIFEDAVEKIQLMQPQFVMSVGDLIDGKLTDSVMLAKQWDEFNGKISPLSMPFFYVPGNHDISNPWMEQEWKRRFTRTYYYFIRKDVLFLCLDTEEGGSSTRLSPEQIEYFRQVLRDHRYVRWTFIFMHRPVWMDENGREEGFEEIEPLLKDRNYTVFSGHHHTYAHGMRSGNHYYALGTTGGGSDLRGIDYGEFDHMTWVTLTGNSPPTIINLKPEGLLKEDVGVNVKLDHE